MKHFKYVDATSFDEAGKALTAEGAGRKAVIAGGTDLLGGMKDSIFTDYPETLVSIGRVEGTQYIKSEGNTFKIGALTKLKDIADDGALQKELPIVSEAAKSVASPLIRNRATIGGNLCQDVRCWFYRYPNHGGGRLECLRKCGGKCYAIEGDNRYHSVFGGMKTDDGNKCKVNCPAGTDIPSYMARIRSGDWDGAARIIMQANPMPMLTSRVCAHTCQNECNQCSAGDSVAISSVERSVGDYIRENIDKFYQAPLKKTGKKVAIVGGGPGGLSAAYFLCKDGHEVVVYDKMAEPGGLLMYAIPHYRMPKGYIREFVEALKKMGVQFIMNTEIGKDVKVEDLEKDYDSIYLGTGGWKRPVLGFDGEELTDFGLDFLVKVKTWMKGKIGQDVLVSGGGNVAMDVALTAKRLGAAKVRLACLEGPDEMPASREEVDRVKSEGVEVMNGWGLSKVLTDSAGKVSGLELKKCVSVFDEHHRFSPKYDEENKTVVKAESILLATGQKVDVSFLGEKYQIELNRGRIEVNEDTQATSRPGVFAGGDVASGPSTVIKAVAAGRVAAKNMSIYLGVDKKEPVKTPEFVQYDVDGVKNHTAAKLSELPIAERDIEKEDTSSLTKDQASEEAKRCMDCACYSVNASDLSPVMVALGAEIVTNKRQISSADFFTTVLKAYDNLEKGEMITEIVIPKKPGYVTGYKKFRMRDSLDFALASMAYAYKLEGGLIKDAVIVMGAIAPVPLELFEVEKLLRGQTPSEALAEEASELAVKGAKGIGHNDYKIDEIKTFVRRLVDEMSR